MNSNEAKILTRDVEAAVVPVGTRVTLKQGESAHITQSLGGSHTVVVNGNMFRIDNWKNRSGNRSKPVTTRKSRSTSWILA
jgi:hypothetical protein